MFGMTIRKEYTARSMSRQPGWTRYELVRPFARDTRGPGFITYQCVSKVWHVDHDTGRRDDPYALPELTREKAPA